MATAAEHYQDAERLICAARGCSFDEQAIVLAAAQVHAVLSLAAIQGRRHYGGDLWAQLIGEPVPEPDPAPASKPNGARR